MRLLILSFISVLFFHACSDKSSDDPSVVLFLVETWPAEWTENGIKDLQSYPALKKITENGVVFTQAFTASPEGDLAKKSLVSGMHTGNLLSDNFSDKNLDNFKNALLENNYQLFNYSTISGWPDDNQDKPSVHIFRLDLDLMQLEKEMADALAATTENDLIVLTALSGPGTAYSESSLRVPLIFYTGNDKVKKGISRQAIHTADLFPTIADFLKIPYDANTTDGKSFYKNIKKPATLPDDRILYWQSPDQNGPEILRYNQWKMRRANPGAEWQLFDMITDPEETDNVSAYHPGKFEKFQEWIGKNKAMRK